MPNPFEPGGTPPPQLDYEVLRLIGHGAYGEVWLVQDQAGRYLACKVIYRESFENDRPYNREYNGLKMFEPVSLLNESQIKVLHIGRRDEAGYFFYIMEPADDLVTGPAIDPLKYIPRTLARELNRRGRLPEGECVRLGLSLSAALQNLHDHNLIHRDVKPENIIFVNGIPKLADIGLVSSVDATVSHVGTHGYLPPEGPVSVQADVYALGKVLYVISTGLGPLDYPELPPDLGVGAEREAFLELNFLIRNACEPDRHQRYQTAGEMHADLTLLSSGQSLRQRRKNQNRTRALARLAAVVVAVALMIGAIVGIQKWRTDKRSSAAAPDVLAEDSAYQRAPETSASYAEVCIRDGFEAWGRDDYPKAKELCAAAMLTAETSQNLPLLDEARFLETETARCESKYLALKPLALRLKERPDDPEANLAVGKFLCFVKNDWQNGLLLLVRGSDDGFRAAAQNELAGKEEIVLGDAWWHLAESTAAEKAACRQRAAAWYLRAIAKAKPPRKAELQQALAERIKTRTTQPAVIHIMCRVANALRIDIFPDEVVWRNNGSTRGDKMNQVLVGNFAGKSTRIIKNTGATRLYPENLDFATARLKIDRKTKKKDKISLKLEVDHVTLFFTDKPSGSSAIEVTLVFGAPARAAATPVGQ